jgi:hypothetical protein
MPIPGVLKKQYGETLEQTLDELIGKYHVVYKVAAVMGVSPHTIRMQLLTRGYQAVKEEGKWVWRKPEPVTE